MFKVVGDIQTNTSLMHNTALILLDLSSAFDTLDHTKLLERLFQNYAITDDCLHWIQSYLNNQSYFVYVNDASSEDNKLMFSIPQGSLLGPMLYTLYTKEIETIALKHKMSVQMYADDTQSYTSFTTDSSTTTE